MKPLKTGGPKNKPELKKLTSERIRALQTVQKTTLQEKSWVEDGSGKEHEKVSLRREKGALHQRKQSYQVVKGAKPLSWVDKDLTKTLKKKSFEENGALQSDLKNRTTKNWVEKDLSKFPIRKREKEIK